MRTSLTNVFWQLIAQGLNLSIPLIVLRIVLSNITFDEYGEIAIILSLIGFVKVIIDFGFNIKGVSILYQEKDISKHKTTVFEIFIIRILISLAVIIIISLVFLFTEKHIEILPFLVIILLSSSFNINYLFNFQEKSQYLTFISFLEKSILLVLLYFVFKENISAKTYILSLSVSTILTILTNLLFFNKSFKSQRIEFDFKHLKYLMQLGFQQLQFNFINCVYTFSIIPIIAALIGTQEAGIYSTAEKIIKAFQIVLQPIINGLQKYFLSLRTNKKLKVYFYSGLLILPIVILIILYSDLLSKLVSNSNNLLISQIIQILSISVLSSYSLSFVTVNIFTPLNMERKVSKDFGIILLIFLILCSTINLNNIIQFSWLIFCFEMSLLILVFKNLKAIPNVKEI